MTATVAATHSAAPQRLSIDHNRRAVVGNQREHQLPRVIIFMTIGSSQEFCWRLQKLQEQAHLSALADVFKVGNPLPSRAHNA